MHAISGTPIVKMQHPDYELYLTGIHAYRNVSCADCHMPYRTEGGVKYTDHHVQSPLLNIANSCAVCHRWERGRDPHPRRGDSDEDRERPAGGGGGPGAGPFRHRGRGAGGRFGGGVGGGPRSSCGGRRFRWDFIAANNGMGFHSPQESMRLLGEAANLAQQVRVQAARVLARKGISEPPNYPDVSTRQKAWEVAETFVAGKGIKLLP